MSNLQANAAIKGCGSFEQDAGCGDIISYPSLVFSSHSQGLGGGSTPSRPIHILLILSFPLFNFDFDFDRPSRRPSSSLIFYSARAPYQFAIPFKLGLDPKSDFLSFSFQWSFQFFLTVCRI
jgi:hypothetical protein